MSYFLRHAGHEIKLLPSRNMKGGEGVVRLIDGMKGSSAKIYDSPDIHLGDHLEAMIQSPLPVLRGQLAWPKDVVEDARGAVVGYLQDHFSGDYLELASMISPSTRPSWATNKMMRRFAYDAALIMAELHSQSILFPDFHPGQLLVSRNRPTILIDMASCQFSFQGTLFGCKVAKAEYQSPDFASVGNWGDVAKLRDVHTDDWSLAVSIFRLAQGCDPFAGTFVGSGVGLKPLERAAAGVFPFSRNCREYLPPKNASPYRLVKSELRNLFDRCFIDGLKRENRALRPTAQEWADTIYHLPTLRDASTSSRTTVRVTKTWKSVKSLGTANAQLRSFANMSTTNFRTWGTVVLATCLIFAALLIGTTNDWSNSTSDAVKEIDSDRFNENTQWNFSKPANVDPMVAIDKLRTRSKSE